MQRAKGEKSAFVTMMEETAPLDMASLSMPSDLPGVEGRSAYSGVSSACAEKQFASHHPSARQSSS
eukprot:scaffold23754_cov106-Isochrysis_galbana.AAC.1